MFDTVILQEFKFTHDLNWIQAMVYNLLFGNTNCAERNRKIWITKYIKAQKKI